MGLPAAKVGDSVVGVDTHIVLVPTGIVEVPVPMQLPFIGKISMSCSPDVCIDGMPAATVGSIAVNLPPHVPPVGEFANPPTNLGFVIAGSATVMINGVPAARATDTVLTCNDPAPLPTSKVVAVSTVFFG